MDLFYGKKVTKRAKKGKARTKARTKGRKMTLAKLRLFAKKRRVSVYKRRGGKKVLLNKKQLMAKLLKMRIKIKQRFGMATVCRTDQRINKRYIGKRGQKQCIQLKSKIALKRLQKLAKANEIAIINKKTGKKLTIKTLKARLTRMKVFHFGA